MSKTIRVVVIRHGERQDEADYRDRKRNKAKAAGTGQGLGKTPTEQSSPPMSDFTKTKIKVDPPLTLEGYLQAKGAFDRLLPMFANHGISVFVSPLKRCIGTTMMMSVSAASSTITSTATVSNTDNTQNSNASNDGPLVLTVVNGLADPAAAIRHHGGSYHAIRQGLVDLAAMDGNDCSGDTPFEQALPPLRQKAYHALGMTDAIAVDNLSADRRGPSGRPIAFMTEAATPGGKRVQLHPLFCVTDPIPNRDSTTTTTCPTRTAQARATLSQNRYLDQLSFRTKAIPRNKHGNTLANFVESASRAVKDTIDAGHDVCFLVSHREAMHILIQDVCRSHVQYSTPYCCVAFFQATITSNTNVGNDDDDVSKKTYNVDWTFDRVVPYERL